MRVLIAVAVLMMCGAMAQRIMQPERQEKAQPVYQIKCGAPDENGTVGCIKYISPLTFDVPAKWLDGNGVLGWQCDNVSADWKDRYLVERADGTYHCLNFSFLSQQR